MQKYIKILFNYYFKFKILNKYQIFYFYIIF